MRPSISSIYGYVAISFLSLSMIFNMGCSVFGVRTAEEVTYKTTQEDGEKEIRQYSSRIIAKTTVAGEYIEAQRQAFRILADYIFGKNVEKQEIAMTTPVTQEPKNTKIAMTAPVTQEKAAEGWTLTFAMPLKYEKLSELPTPVDERIELLQRPEGLFAVIRYTWLTSEGRNQEKAAELLNWLDKEGKYEAISTPYYAGYDPPWTIPFLRRQEMLVEIKTRHSTGSVHSE